MAMLFAKKIINGELNFSDVPRLLKSRVKEILEEQGIVVETQGI